jgi:hypothetical protein
MVLRSKLGPPCVVVIAFVRDSINSCPRVDIVHRTAVTRHHENMSNDPDEAAGVWSFSLPFGGIVLRSGAYGACCGCSWVAVCLTFVCMWNCSYCSVYPSLRVSSILVFISSIVEFVSRCFRSG